MSDSLALVVIGRNPGADLPRLLGAVAGYGFADVVFVDSGSTDDSASVAGRMGVRAVVLPPSEAGAAAARAAGTLAVERADWILYLDSDMVVDLAALEGIRRMLPALPAQVVGVTGLVRDRYPDGRSRVRHAHERPGDRATYFGGAVVLRRRAVLAAGNWNPRVIANEELDLHARLRANGGYVRFEDVVLVDHFTALQRASEKLAFLVNWRGRAGSRYGAPGMALRSCISRGAVLHLLALSPEPFVAVPVTLVAIAFAAYGMPGTGVLILVVLWGWIAWRRGPQYLAPSYLLFPQILVGALRYGSRRR